MALLPILGAIGMGVGIAGGNAARRRTARRQDESIADWLAYQAGAKAEAEASVDANRERNYGALGGALEGADVDARNALIGTETDRVFNLSDAPDPGFELPWVNPKTFAGRKLAEATREAREMIRAQSRTRATTDSFGGMGRARGDAMTGAGNDIAFNNEMSGIDLGVLAKKQAVQPITYQHNSTGLGELLTSVGSSMLGSGLADVFTGAAATPAAPGTSIRPVPRPAPSAPAVPSTSGTLGFGTLPPMGYLFPSNRRDDPRAPYAHGGFF